MKDKDNEALMLNLPTYKGDEPYIFVSYAHKDKNYVYPEILRLHELGCRIWYDTGIEPGQRFWKEIAAAIKKCSFFVVFLSPDAATSSNVANEISFAITCGVKLLAIHLKKTELSDELQIQIGRFQAILKYKFTEEAYIQKVVDALPKEILENKDKYFGKGSLLEERQNSIEMADDIKIIEQIEKQIGKKLKSLPLEDIREKNGYAFDNTGQVKGLNLDGTKVKDISILRNLGGLTHLSLVNNQILDITPLRTLTHLKKLRLSQNKITDITAMTTLSNLEELFLNANHRISDISSLSGLTGITQLSLSHNKIINLYPLTTLTRLKILWLSSNNIDDLKPLKALTQLETLGVGSNKITDLTHLKELTNLKGLDVSNNKITKLPPDIDRWWSSMEINWENKPTTEGLNLFGNPLIDPPVEIVKQGKVAVKNYFDSLGDTLGGRQSSIYPQHPILLVYDEEHFLHSIELFLKSHGIMNVESCRDSRNVMPLLKEKKFSLILLDILMPYIRGDELLPVIVEKYPDIPIILLTTVYDTQFASEIKKKGGIDYLVKPVESAKLISSIENALKYRQNSIAMADDIKIIEQIEKQIGEKLKSLPLKNIMESKNNGYVLDHAGQVQGLNLDDTKVEDISILRYLGGLTHLSLANNQIKDITPLRELKNLAVLNLCKNKITDITPLQDMAKLEELYLSKNKIMKLTVLSFFKNLKRLGLGNSGITDFVITLLSALTNLEKLALYENQITDITPLRELKNLKVLDVRRNRIEKLPPEIITWWPNLEIKWEDNFIPGLILLGNPLTDPPVEIVKQGKTAIKNYFDFLGVGNRQSSIVMTDDNKIIEQIESQIDKKLKPLPLKNIMESKNNGYVLDHVGHVQGLNLDDIKVKDISFLRNLRGLTHLSLANNQISDITPLGALTMLTTLILERNQIADITPLRELTKLTILWLNSNKINDHITLSALTNLKELYLWETQLEDLTPLSPLTLLTKLDLCGNQIKDLTPLSPLTMLTTLILERNQITDVTPLRELKNLKALNIRQNRIEQLPPDMISWWPDMEMKWEGGAFNGGLNLSDNPLTDPPVEIVKKGKVAVKNYFEGERQSPITPEFENDIFISYCHVDNVAPANERGWVDIFHEYLESRLVRRFGHKKITIWRDKKLQGSTLFEERIQEKIRKSNLFFVLLSPNYLKSEYCLKELEWFYREAEKSRYGLSVHNEYRIFNVLLRNIPHAKWPKQLQGTSGFPMHDQKEGSENLGEFLEPGDNHYKEMLRKIVDAVEMILNPGQALE